jgi:acetyl-CoA acetyltransferase
VTAAAVAGAAMTSFGKHHDRALRELVIEATDSALADAGAEPGEVEAVFFGNAAAGLLSGQEMIRGQVALRGTPLEGTPLVNVENACASSSTAARLAWQAVVAGEVEVAMVIGAEKMAGPDRDRPFRALASALDIEGTGLTDYVLGLEVATDSPRAGSVFMDLYAADARAYLDRTDATVEDFAAVVAKTRFHGTLNPRAQFRTPVSPAQVLASRTIAAPLTRDMCSPIADGAASLLIASRDWRGLGPQAIPVRAMAMGSGVSNGGSDLVRRTASSAYDKAGIGPENLDVIELHDAAASAELEILEELGVADAGEAPRLLRSGATRLGGDLPVNPSGGLISRGHPIGATGAAQLVELVDQLRGRAGARQVANARVGLAENAGGHLGSEPAVCVVTILSRD